MGLVFVSGVLVMAVDYRISHIGFVDFDLAVDYRFSEAKVTIIFSSDFDMHICNMADGSAMPLEMIFF
jgi:hypothetical protein